MNRSKVKSGIVGLFLVAWVAIWVFNFSEILRFMREIQSDLNAWIERIAPAPTQMAETTDLDVALFFASVVVIVTLISAAVCPQGQHRDSEKS